MVSYPPVVGCISGVYNTTLMWLLPIYYIASDIKCALCGLCTVCTLWFVTSGVTKICWIIEVAGLERIECKCFALVLLPIPNCLLKSSCLGFGTASLAFISSIFFSKVSSFCPLCAIFPDYRKEFHMTGSKTESDYGVFSIRIMEYISSTKMIRASFFCRFAHYFGLKRSQFTEIPLYIYNYMP